MMAPNRELLLLLLWLRMLVLLLSLGLLIPMINTVQTHKVIMRSSAVISAVVDSEQGRNAKRCCGEDGNRRCCAGSPSTVFDLLRWWRIRGVHKLFAMQEEGCSDQLA